MRLPHPEGATTGREHAGQIVPSALRIGVPALTCISHTRFLPQRSREAEDAEVGDEKTSAPSAPLPLCGKQSVPVQRRGCEKCRLTETRSGSLFRPPEISSAKSGSHFRRAEFTPGCSGSLVRRADTTPGCSGGPFRRAEVTSDKSGSHVRFAAVTSAKSGGHFR